MTRSVVSRGRSLVAVQEYKLRHFEDGEVLLIHLAEFERVTPRTPSNNLYAHVISPCDL